MVDLGRLCKAFESGEDNVSVVSLLSPLLFQVGRSGWDKETPAAPVAPSIAGTRSVTASPSSSTTSELLSLQVVGSSQDKASVVRAANGQDVGVGEGRRPDLLAVAAEARQSERDCCAVWRRPLSTSVDWDVEMSFKHIKNVAVAEIEGRDDLEHHNSLAELEVQPGLFISRREYANLEAAVEVGGASLRTLVLFRGGWNGNFVAAFGDAFGYLISDTPSVSPFCEGATLSTDVHYAITTNTTFKVEMLCKDHHVWIDLIERQVDHDPRRIVSSVEMTQGGNADPASRKHALWPVGERSNSLSPAATANGANSHNQKPMKKCATDSLEVGRFFIEWTAIERGALRTRLKPRAPTLPLLYFSMCESTINNIPDPSAWLLPQQLLVCATPPALIFDAGVFKCLDTTSLRIGNADDEGMVKGGAHSGADPPAVKFSVGCRTAMMYGRVGVGGRRTTSNVMRARAASADVQKRTRRGKSVFLADADPHLSDEAWLFAGALFVLFVGFLKAVPVVRFVVSATTRWGGPVSSRCRTPTRSMFPLLVLVLTCCGAASAATPTHSLAPDSSQGRQLSRPPTYWVQPPPHDETAGGRIVMPPPLNDALNGGEIAAEAVVVHSMQTEKANAVMAANPGSTSSTDEERNGRRKTVAADNPTIEPPLEHEARHVRSGMPLTSDIVVDARSLAAEPSYTVAKPAAGGEVGDRFEHLRLDAFGHPCTLHDETKKRWLATSTVATVDLKTAVEDAGENDFIVATPETTFSGPLYEIGSLSASLCISKVVSLKCAGASVLCKLDGVNANRVIAVGGTATSGTITMEGFLITRGKSSNKGGGMAILAGTVLLTSCSFESNSVTDWGGGMYCETSTVSLTGCSFTSNSSGNGFFCCYSGGGFFINESSVTLLRCSFTSNFMYGGGGEGGALYIHQASSVTLWGCTFSNNLAGSSGADIRGPATVLDTCLSADYGILKGAELVTAGVSGSPFSYICCASGRYISSATSECTSCGVGLYLNYATTPAARDCIVCPAGSYAASTGTASCSACPAGKYLSDPGTSATLHDDAADCSDCPVGRYLTDSTTVALHDSVDDCQSCEAGKYSSSATSPCSACVGSTYTSTPGQAACTSCSGGNLANAEHTACLSSYSCGVGYGLSDDAGSCVPCPIGKYKGGEAATQCTACEAGKTSAVVGSTAATSCASCDVGKYNQDGVGGLCTDCAAGKANASSGSAFSSACVDCEKGKFSSAPSSEVCVVCAVGRFTEFASLTVCTFCDNGKTIYDDGSTAGEHDSASDCTFCAPGKYANVPSLCTSCPVGRSNSDSGSIDLTACVSCAIGMESSADLASCAPCPEGKYNPSSASSCVSCGVGKYLSSTGASNEMACQTCSPGTSTNNIAGSSTCTDCAPGRAAPSSGFNQCDSCVGGTYAAGDKSVRCVPCEVGKYADTVESDSCKSCDAGKQATSTGSITCALCLGGEYGVSCAKCEPGKYSNPGSAECSACNVGFVSSEGKGNCEYCGPGKFALHNMCESCEAGTYSVGGVTACTTCNSDSSYSADAAATNCASCTNCAAGRYQTAACSTTSDRECADCVAGKYGGGGTVSGCTDCAVGKYSEAVASSCITHTYCAAGTYISSQGTPSADSACSDCSAGSYSVGGATSCTACAAGFFTASPKQAGCSSCFTCAAGRYQTSACSTTSDRECADCVAGKYGGGGTVSGCTDCVATFGYVSNAVRQKECQYCGPGKFAENNDCKKCASNTYSVGGTAVCTPCKDGAHSPEEASSCEQCLTGRYFMATENVCKDCPVGRYSATGASSEELCTVCALGTVSLGGTGNCEYCGPGKYADENDQVCRDCGVNYFSVGGVNSCSPCENGGHSDARASSCENCLAGRYFDRAENDCLACQTGRYSDTGAADQDGCKSCDAGFISDKVDGAGFCSPCTAGKFSSPDRATCEDCSPGKISGIASVQCIPCEAGKYADGASNVACKFCDDLSALKGSTTLSAGSASVFDCRCSAGEFKSDSTQQCERVTEGITADAFGMNVTNLILESGFWRTSQSSSEILPCLSDAHCKGGNDPIDICAVGYEGPLCAVCKEGYAPRGAGRGLVCEACSGSAAASVGVGVALLAIFLLAALYYFCIRKTTEEEEDSDSPERSNSCLKRMQGFSERHAERIQIALQLLKMFVAYFQIVGGLAFAFDLNFPPMFTSAVDFLSGLVNVNFISLMPLGCVFPTNYHKALLGYTLIPLFVCFVLFAIYAVAGKKKNMTGLRIRLYGTFLLMTFMILPTVSVKIFSTFACKTFDGSYGRYLKVDYSIDCDSSEHTMYAAYAAVMIFVYPVGIPLMYYVLLRREKCDLDPPVDVSASETERSAAALKQREAIELSKPALKRLSFLYSAYAPRYWWFEVFETLRKLSLTGLLVLVSPGSAGQIVISMLVCLFSMRVYSECKPFLDGAVYFIFEASQWQLFMTMFAALAIRVNIDDEGLEDKRAFDIALFVVQFIAPAAVVFASFLQIGGVDILSLWARLVSGKYRQSKVEDLTTVTQRATEMNRIGIAECGKGALTTKSRGDTIVSLGDTGLLESAPSKFTVSANEERRQNL